MVAVSVERSSLTILQWVDCGDYFQKQIGAKTLIINKERWNQFRQFPRLVPKDPRIATNPQTGEILVSYWGKKKKGKVLLDTEKKGDGEYQFNFRTYSDIETAIRGLSHIIENTRGQEDQTVKKTRATMKFVSIFINYYLSGMAKGKTPLAIANEISQLLIEADLKDHNQVLDDERISQEITAANRRVKGIDRLDPSKRKILAVFSSLRLVKQLLSTEAVEEKYFNLLEILYAQRAFERSLIIKGLLMMRKVLADKTFRRQNLEELKNYFQVFLNPETLRLAPYRNAVLVIHYWLYKDSLMSYKNDKDNLRSLVKRMIANDLYEKLEQVEPIKSYDNEQVVMDRLTPAIRQIQDVLEISEGKLQFYIPLAMIFSTSRSEIS